MLDSADEIIADDQFAPDYDWIYDLRFIHAAVITVAEMEQIVERFRRFQEEGLLDDTSRSVIVGTDDDLRYAGTLYQQKASRPEALFAVVETIDEARRWLGIEASAEEIGLTD